MINTTIKKTQYTLMHLDRKVLSFDFGGKVKVLSKKFMPYDLYVEEKNDIDTRTNNALNIINWLSKRVISIDRKYSKIIYNFLNLPQNNDEKTKAIFSLKYHSLCLTDVYWVKEKNEKVSYKDINLYDNSLSNAYVDVFLRGKGITIDKKAIDSRDVATSGQCAKAWVRTKNRKFFLYKDGNVLQVKNEIMASKIIECFDIDFVKYTKNYYDKKLVSSCEIITSKSHSILNKLNLEIYCINKDIDIYDYILKLDAYSYYMMNIIDYLIGNDDRHPNNWGVLIDNKTNKILKLYPLMDFNKAFNNYNIPDGGPSLTTKVKMSQKDAAILAVRNIGLNQIKNISQSIFDGNKKRYIEFKKRLNILKNA